MIKVYSKEGCSYCDQAKALLTRHGFIYDEIRIDEDDVAKDFLVGQGHRSVPQLYVNESLLVEGGFQGLKEMTIKQIQQRINKINGN